MPVHEYERIALELASEIEAGEYLPGTALPTIPELMDRFRVSRITVRGGLEELQRRGLVYTGYVEGKRGTIVRSRERMDFYASDSLRADRPKPSMDAFTENAARIGKQAGKQFSMRIQTASPEVTKALGVDRNDLVVVRTLYQLLDGEPWSREVGYYPMNLAQEVGLDTPNDIPRGTIRAIAEAGYEEIAHFEAVIYDTAGPEDARDLQVSVGTPLFRQTRIAATAHLVTRVMEYTRMAERQRLIWELGDASGIEIIRRNLSEEA